MTLELAIVAAIVVAGAMGSYAAGLRGAGQAVAGLVCAATLPIVVGVLVLACGLPVTPLVVVPVTVAGAGAAAVWRAVHGGVNVAWLWHAVALSSVVVAIVIARSQLLYNWTADTLEYLNIGALLAAGHYDDSINANILEKRAVGVGIMHMPATLQSEWLLVAVPILTALALAAAMAWTLWRVAASRYGNFIALSVASFSVVILLATNRMVYTALYINGHITVALAYVIILGGAWLLAERKCGAEIVVPMTVAMIAAAATRPDAVPLLAAVVLPVALMPQLPRVARRVLCLAGGAGALVWQLLLVTTWITVEGQPTAASLVAVVAALGIIVLGAFVGVPFFERHYLPVLACAEAAVWLGLLALSTVSTGVILESAKATWTNTVGNAGSWFPMLPAVAVLVAAAIVLLRDRNLVPMRFAVTTFVPLMFILAVVRLGGFDVGAYRVGPGDSLNRSWAHIYPIAVMLLVGLLLVGVQRFVRTSRLDRDTGMADEQSPPHAASPLVRRHA